MIKDTSEDLKANILDFLKANSDKTYSTLDISNEFKIEHQVSVGEAKSLEMAEVITLEKAEEKAIKLTPDGKDCLDNGSPDNQLLKFLSDNNGQATKKLISEKLGPIGDRGFAALIKKKAIVYNKATDLVVINPEFKVEDILSKDETRDFLVKFNTNNTPSEYEDSVLKNYEKTLKYIKVETTNYFKILKGKNFEIGLKKLEKDLTKEHMQLNEENFAKLEFKKYNYIAEGKEVNNGALHPLLRVRTQFREILLELGFQEMPTNNFVESSFWNFDSLFQPQQHPARDAHDTFFITHPKYSKVEKFQPEYFQRVKEVHEIGGYGSLGWQYNWSAEESSKNILRTHTTSVSSQMLFKLAEDYKKTGVFTPKKYFSIDRVFRNESMDATHLAEFHQIEGLIADYNLGLGHLIAVIEDFFHRFGIKELKFKPAYNPYTEPSMEIFAKHEGLGKWVEIGNSGIFRPEMLLPMGLPEDVSVIAWGLSLERPTMIHYGLKNIRDLFGHEVNIAKTKSASIYCINI